MKKEYSTYDPRLSDRANVTLNDGGNVGVQLIVKDIGFFFRSDSEKSQHLNKKVCDEELERKLKELKD